MPSSIEPVLTKLQRLKLHALVLNLGTWAATYVLADLLRDLSLSFKYLPGGPATVV